MKVQCLYNQHQDHGADFVPGLTYAFPDTTVATKRETYYEHEINDVSVERVLEADEEFTPIHREKGGWWFRKLPGAPRTVPEEAPKVQSTAPSPDLSVAVKADNGKPRLSLIPPSASLALARVMTFGAKKYAAHNFRKGFDFSRLLDAAQRHMLAFQSGEDRDPETGEYHPAHAMFCMAALIEHMELGLGNDDRWKPPS